MGYKMLNCAIVGCGKIAGGFEDILDTQYPYSHAGSYDISGQTKLVSVCDVSVDAVNEFGKRWNAKPYCDLEKMFECEDIDILSVCTPPSVRVEVISLAIKKCKSLKTIWCEKPLATSIAEAREIIDLCKSNGILLVINNWRRWDNMHNIIRDIISSGKIGNVNMFLCHSHAGIINTGSHLFDLVCQYAESKFSSIFGVVVPDGSTDPGFVGGGFLENGAFVSISSAWSKLPRFGMEIIGEEGSIEAFSCGVLINSFLVKNDFGEKIYRRSDYSFKSPMHCEIDYIVGALSSNVEYLDPEYAIDTLVIAAAAYKSSSEGCSVNLPLSEHDEFYNIIFLPRISSMTKDGSMPKSWRK